MRRKIVKQGTSTMMVSLPSKWASKFKLKKGDEINVEEKEKYLIISTEKNYNIDDIEINIDNLKPMVLRLIASLYKSGYDKVKIMYSDPNGIIEIQNTLKNEISGFEIIEQAKNYCILKKIEEGLNEGFDPILRRTFLLLLTMAEDSEETLKNGDFESLTRLKYLEETNNRLTTYLRRNLTKYGYKEHNKIHFIYHIIEELERIADQYKYLFGYILAKKRINNFKISKDVLTYYHQVSSILRNYYELFYNYDVKLIANIGKLRKEMTNKINEKLEEGKTDSVLIHYLVSIMNIVFEMIEPTLSLHFKN